MAQFTLRVNDETREVDVAPETPLLYVLRNELGLTATRYGCGKAQCGACMVVMDGEATPSCVMPVVAAAEQPILTLEGLADGDRLDPLQQAFIDEQAVQCGFCITGMIMSAHALLERTPRPSRAEIKQALASNLCGCGTHRRIVNAVERAAERRFA